MTTPLNRPLRRVETKTRLEVDTWPDLDKTSYKFRTVGRGEAIAGPFMFGRAFDSPPFFTFSAVATASLNVTVGVVEWLQDEQNMYVGANLWVVIGTGSGCYEPLLYGDNILRDPGFENHVSTVPTGPRGEVFPGEVSSSTQQPQVPLWAREFNAGLIIYEGHGPLSGWVTFTNIQPSSPIISTKNPDSGLYHVRQLIPAGFTLGRDMLPVGFYMCTRILEHTSASFWKGEDAEGNPLNGHGVFSARVEAGDQIEFSVRAMSTPDVDNPQCEMSIIIYDADLLQIGGNLLQPAVGPGYTRVTVTATAPAGSVYLWVSARPVYLGFTVDKFYDMDSAVLKITPGAGNENLSQGLGGDQSDPNPVFQIDVNFEGQLLKGYGNIYPVEPASAPVKVVLS